MQLKWGFIISCCWITNAFGQYQESNYSRNRLSHPASSSMTSTNYMPPLDNSAQVSPQNYNLNNGDAPRRPHSDVVADLHKKTFRSAESTQNHGGDSTNYDRNSDLDSQSWDDNQNENALKSSVDAKLPKPSSNILKNQVIIITTLISVVMIGAGVAVYCCNRKSADDF